MSKVLVPLANGCEEIEAVTVIDILRRAGVQVIAASLEDKLVKCSRGTVILADTTLNDALAETFDMIVLPGGMPGAEHLKNDRRIMDLLQKMARGNKYIAAICAAPIALHAAGLLANKTVTSFPGHLDKLPGSHTYSAQAVVTDGNIITSRGPGTSMDFALTLVEQLAGYEQRQQIEAQLQRS